MNTPLRLRIFVIVLIAIPLAILAIGFSLSQYREQVRNTERMTHASDVAVTLDQLFTNVLMVSNRGRSFILSGNPELLIQHQRAVEAIPPLLDRIRDLSAASPSQSALVVKLEAALQSKLRFHEDLVARFRVEGFDGVREMLISDTGAARLEAFRTQVSAVRSGEYLQAQQFLAALRDGLLLQLALLLTLLLCGGIWMGILSTTAIRGILIPVQALIDHVDRIAAGETVPDLPIPKRDEIGLLTTSVNVMSKRISDAQAAREVALGSLARERENLVDAVESLNEGFAAFDARELMIQSNNRYRELYPELADLAVRGVSKESLLRQRAMFGNVPAAKGRSEEWVAEKLEEFRHPGPPREYQLADGRVIQKSEYRTGSGGTVSVYVDITQIKEAESSMRRLNAELDQRVTERTNDLDAANRQLERLNAELATLIRAAPVAIISLDPQGQITMWNPAAERMTGYDEASARTALPRLVPPDKDAEFAQLLAGVQAGEVIDNIELTLIRRDGTTAFANLSAAALVDARGTGHGAILTLVDLTESRILQEQFQQSQKMEVVAELTAGVAHDFNNLLSIIIANLDMLEARVPSDGLAREMLAAAMRASLSGVALNRQLLTFSRRDSLRSGNVDIRETIAGLSALLHPTLGEHIEAVIKVDADLWPAVVDASLLESAILNLAVNARDAMPGGGRLTIVASNSPGMSASAVGPDAEAGDYVLIKVSDSGTGMTPEVAARAFDPFFTTKAFGKGSGLGLSMVYGFVRQSRGAVKVDSRLGKGTCFRIYLPRGPLPATLAEPEAIYADDLRGSGECVLVVEDNNALRRAVVRQLCELGYTTIEADSGHPALEILASSAAIDVMLTDIVMPGGIDGRELARRAAKLRADLPVIFTSGFPASEDGHLLTDWEETGGTALAKPVSRRKLAEQLGKALRRPRRVG